MTDLHDHVEWLKREVAVPGTFPRYFPDTTSEQLAAALVDGLYRAKLDGWFPLVAADPDSCVTTPDVSLTGVALVVLYAGIKIVQNQITNLPASTTYKAPGGLEATTSRAASVLTERLKEMQADLTDLLDQARARTPVTIHMLDGYAIRIAELYAPERIPYGYQRVDPLALLSG